MLVIAIFAMLRAVVDVLERDAVVVFTEEPVALVISGFIGCVGAVSVIIVDHDIGDLCAVLANVGFGSARVSILVLARVAVVPSVVHIIDGQFLILSIDFTHDGGRGFESKGGGVNATVEAVVFLAGVPVFRGATAQVEVVFVRTVHAVF